jgi:diguanylate cyclase
MQVASDTLSGLPGRTAFERALEGALSSSQPTALGLLDIDYFMQVNDTWGHDVGDRLLQALATLMRQLAPDASYRLSGDEFAVLMPGLSLEQAFLKMEALRERVFNAADQFNLPDGRPVSLTIGVAQHPRDAKDAWGLLSAADAALAAAKENGRNQVGLPQPEEMIMKSCYYPATSVRKLKALAERLQQKESRLLREALDDLFRKYDIPHQN